MEKILYIVGAGFSAPLGLPVIADFLSASKDMYETNPEKYHYFATIFERIDRMGKAKNYMHCDLFNIEEILSILEMESFTEGRNQADEFSKFIADVIRFKTPTFHLEKNTNIAPWHQGIFYCQNNKINHRIYFSFVACLFNLMFKRDTQKGEFMASRNQTPNFKYGVISMNYDLVLESIADAISKQYFPDAPLKFVTPKTIDTSPYLIENNVCMAKLHGSIEPLTIVPPTWNKVKRPEMEDAWRLARRLVSEANEIFFLGYSMAPADLYMRYLLVTGILESINLKSISVICRGDDAAKNYQSVFNFKGYKYHKRDVLDYLGERLLTNAGQETNSFDFGEGKYKYEITNGLKHA